MRRAVRTGGAIEVSGEIEAMLDAMVSNEQQPDIVQISGGEPTIHPEFFAILDAARRRPIKHLMVNTNGIRIAQDEASRSGWRVHAGVRAVSAVRFAAAGSADAAARRRPASHSEKALETLNRLNISTTLVVTVERGVNDDELGPIVDFALEQPCVRGVTFQPVQQAGRLQGTIRRCIG